MAVPGKRRLGMAVFALLVTLFVFALLADSAWAQDKDEKKSEKKVRADSRAAEVGAQQASPSGPLAGARVTFARDADSDGCVDVGDILRVAGDRSEFTLESSATITISNETGDQATFVDPSRATITIDDNGRLEIEVDERPLDENANPIPAGTFCDLTSNEFRVVTSDGINEDDDNGGGGGGGRGDGPRDRVTA